MWTHNSWYNLRHIAATVLVASVARLALLPGCEAWALEYQPRETVLRRLSYAILILGALDPRQIASVSYRPPTRGFTRGADLNPRTSNVSTTHLIPVASALFQSPSARYTDTVFALP
jgi:hypothetical protein